ncbi:OLC1v1029818C4 [Oldenlandia corymbosa var. corymbosa]|uniref:OLC1v1029818C4 n=1 Tax=Oldenlandia corymbosa var. corymbosa TaxID=529605 RepID=A0AAV1CHY4_OLDCO|nr:OLC1v1029818C4 [Oldenlandia corymbosa var. corymbosa]
MANQQYEKMQLRQNYRNLWHTDLMSTIQADPPYCCLALWCGPCVSYMLRKRALYNDMSRYVCCAGYMPCSGRCGESKCPEFCLATEVFLCFGNSVASTRFLLQDEFNIQTTQCDNCIIVQTLFLSGLASYIVLFIVTNHVAFCYLPKLHTFCFPGFHVLPLTNRLHIFHCCYDCWK